MTFYKNIEEVSNVIDIANFRKPVKQTYTPETWVIGKVPAGTVITEDLLNKMLNDFYSGRK